MAEVQWWLLIVGLVAGGALVAALSMDSSRHDEDLAADERAAEATFIADQLIATGRELDGETVEAVLLAHQAYLTLPPPDRIESLGPAAPVRGSAGDRDADRQADEVRDGRRGGADEDLPPAGEERPAAGQEADPGAHGEEPGDR